MVIVGLVILRQTLWLKKKKIISWRFLLSQENSLQSNYVATVEDTKHVL